MGFITSAAVKLNWIGTIIYDYLFGWVKSWGIQSKYIGAFAVTVILFTVFLKTLTFPLDLWQKGLGRKNAKTMDEMKPELDKLTKQYGNNRQLLMQKQREVYKKHKYSMGKTCLPMLVTVGLFFIIFSGFNSAVKYHNAQEFFKLQEAYTTAYQASEAEAPGDHAAAAASAKQAVLDAYSPEGFLWTKNIFRADNWKSPVPSFDDFNGTSMGQLGLKNVVDLDVYNTVMEPVMELYNYNDSGKTVWNGYLILPILSILLNILSSKLVKPPAQPTPAGQTEEQRKMQEQQQKMMAYMMPLVFGVFTLFYSTAFTLYFLASNVITLGFNYVYNVVTKKKDAEEKDRRLSSTIKK